MPFLQFDPNFVWGVATAAAQIEGAAFADGKTASIWDTFSRRPGAVRGGDTLDDACDHYHRFDEDFALMRKLGIRDYRLSLAWTRLLPDGRSAVNQRGIDFYQRLFDSLERHEITPWVTLFHWDLPQYLEDEGGWRSRKTVDAFARYADVAVRAFGQRVKRWITVNEIFCFTEQGYGLGKKAPGARESAAVVNQAYHHALLAHGHAVRAVREHGMRGASVGLSDNPVVSVPLTDAPADVAAARQQFVADNIRVLDPLFRGQYAAQYLEAAGASGPRVAAGDFDLIAQPLDFIGLNIYTGQVVRADANGRPDVLAFSELYPRSSSPWQYLLPRVLYWGPRFFHELYGPLPIYITENGAGYDEPAEVDPDFADVHRCECLRTYLRELQSAISSGVPIRGYFHWSFIDNFEWEDGYARRFGLVHVNYRTQKRTPKLSARWYSHLIRQGHAPAHAPQPADTAPAAAVAPTAP